MTLFLYLLRSLVTSTAFAVGALGFIVFPALAVSAVQRLGGVSLYAVLRYIPMIGIELTPYLVSLGFLLGVVSTFGRLAADREWIAIQMAGVHPLRPLVPATLVAILLGLGTVWLQDVPSPHWKLEQDNFRSNMLVQNLRNLAPGRTEFDIGRFYLSARGRDGTAFIDAQIRAPGQNEGEDDYAVVADRVEIGFDDKFMYLTLAGVRSVRESTKAEIGLSGHRVELSRIFAPRNKDERRAKYRSNHAMRKELAAGTAGDFANEYRYEIHSRWAVGATYLLFVLIGMPTGLWLRAGTQLAAMGVASLYAFVYFIVSLRLGKELASAGAVSPEVAAWSTNVLALGIGIVMVWRTCRR
ncbi:MAG: LptF/LptG family permease [Planctomycetota bacterium]